MVYDKSLRKERARRQSTPKSRRYIIWEWNYEEIHILKRSRI